MPKKASCFKRPASQDAAGDTARARVAASSARSAKQLVELRRDAFVTKSGLVSVLRNIKENGLPDSFSRPTQQRALEKLCFQPTAYGPILRTVQVPTKDGGPLDVWVQMPQAMLCASVRTSAPLREFLRDVLEDRPPSPDRKWSLIVYTDGVSPAMDYGKKKDKRGVDVIYWSFLELAPFLFMEELWFCISATEELLVHDTVEAGISHVARVLLEQVFFNPDENDLSIHGAEIDLSEAGDGSILITIIAEHIFTIADEKALCMLLFCKGHGGTRPCAICRDVLHHDTEYADFDTSNYFVPMTNIDIARRRKHTDASVRNLVARLREKWLLYDAGTMGPTAWQAFTQRHGWSYSPAMLLASEQLNYKAISTLVLDWCHIWAVDGILEKEVNLCMQAIKSANNRAPMVSGRDLHEYLQKFQWPKMYAHARNVFEKLKFSASASECLSAAPVLEKFFSECLPDVHPFGENVKSLILCARLMKCTNMFRGAWRRQHSFATQLRNT